MPRFILKDVLETPQPLYYALLALLVVTRLRKDAARPTTLLFSLLLIVLSILRFLSSASETILYYPPELQLLPWDSASPLKILLLYWVGYTPLWDRCCLGRYRNNIACSTPKVSWRGAVIRLAYHHVIDKAYVVWLRFLWTVDDGKPFTQYVNNSEILMGVLAGLMVAWSLLRVCARKGSTEMVVITGE